jgi:hypothetical protein
MPPDPPVPPKVVEPAVSGDAWNGPWGSIAPVPRSVETLCLQEEAVVGKPRIHYFPYRTIARWIWSMEAPETLEIQVAGMNVAISGTGLRRLAEALESGQLRLVRWQDPPDLTGEIGIRAVVMDDGTS